MGCCGLPEEGRRGENCRNDMALGRQSIAAFANGRSSGCLKQFFKHLPLMRILRTFPLTLHPARYIKALMVGKKSENKAVGMSRGGRNTKIHTLVDGLGNPLAFILSLPAEIMIPPMLYRCSRRSTSREVTSLEIRRTEHKRSASILHPKGPPIPFHPERTAILLGRWTGTHIKSAI